MLMDKGYYDYDYTEPKEEVVVEKHKRTHEQTQSIFTRMGFGKLKKLGEPTPPTDEEIQAAGLEFIKGRGKHNNLD